MTFKKDKTTTQLNHLEPRAHEKNRVWHVLNAHGAVWCLHTPPHTRESLLLESDFFYKKETTNVQVFRKK